MNRDMDLSEDEDLDIFSALTADNIKSDNTRKNDQNIIADLDSDHDDLYIAAKQADANRQNNRIKGSKKSGSFQGFGLNAKLNKAITRKGYTIPTPIQRKTIPIILDGQDVVGMARTGSGKTAAFVIPMLERLKSHSAKVGARAVVLSPSRELALQTLKVVIELGKGSDLRCVLLVGGDSLEDQFSSMTTNPDIIIATPGRFEHLQVEMGLDLSSVKYVVFDEADRLFEMGFAAQLTEILHALPNSRQTLLFSATLPKSLVEFARAGLQEPKLIRLDAESKISPDLQSAFFMVNPADKEGALLHILSDVIKMPTTSMDETITNKPAYGDKAYGDKNSKKRKRDGDRPKANELPTIHSTIIFTATKHHVDYLASLLKTAGYATSYVYGALDQTARKMQVEDFRNGNTTILVVTDVAARGIDIPILANVINYDFPPQAKVFVHRVGRTARAGRQGWSYNLVTTADLPYLLDLQLFLGGNLVCGREGSDNVDLKNNIVIGTLSRQRLDRSVEEVNKIISDDADLAAQKDVSVKGEKQYIRTRNSASAESAKRSKDVAKSIHLKELHPIFQAESGPDLDSLRDQMLAKVSGFRPNETIFELGKKGQPSETVNVIKKRRDRIQRQKERQSLASVNDDDVPDVPDNNIENHDDLDDTIEVAEDSDSDLEVTVYQPSNKKQRINSSLKSSFQDSEHFMGYLPTSINISEDAAYSVNPSASTSNHFLTAARGATFDLTNDESSGHNLASKPTGLRWDKKSKRYVSRANDLDGSRLASSNKSSDQVGKRLIRSESGGKIPASMKSGRFDAWRKANRVSNLPKVGEIEKANAGKMGIGSRFGPGREDGGRFKHRQNKAPKEADRFRDDYYKKKKQIAAAKERNDAGNITSGMNNSGGRKGGKKGELRKVDDVRKLRQTQQKRKDKNARPSRKST